MSSESNLGVRTLADIAHNAVTAWVVLALSLLLTALAWQVSTQYVERRAQERFQYAVDDAKFAIAKRMQEYEQTLRSGVALFNASGRLATRQEWATFVNTLQIGTYFPGLQGIGFALWVQPHERQAVIDRVRADGYPDFTIKPADERDVYSTIIYLEPLDARNLRAFGYDMFSEVTRRTAMAYARDHMQASVSGRVVLLQETEQDVQAGFLMYLPVYRAGAEIATVAQRQAALLGFVYSPFRVKDLMHGILGQGTPELDFQIYDGHQIGRDALLFDTLTAWRQTPEPASEPISEAGAHAPAYRINTTIDLPGRTWTVDFSSRQRFEEAMSSSQPWLVAIGGLVVDVLLFSIIMSLSRQRKQVVAKATSMTRELRRNRGQFHAITETAHDAIVSADDSGKIIYCNPAACAIFGVDSGKLINQPIAVLLPERLRSTWQTPLLRLLEPGGLASARNAFEALGVRADGEEFPLEISVSSWAVETQTHFALLMRDISERKRVENLKNEFVSTVSHELRTPLTAIRGALGLLCAGKKGQVPAAQHDELMGIAYQNTERLVHLVNDILDLEKLESGQMTMERQVTHLPELLQQAVEENRPYALSHEVTLVLMQPLPNISIWADPNRLRQVLANLISNAIKFSPSGAKVLLAAAVQGKGVRISVTDSGEGIPARFRDRIFQRFSQVDGSDTRRKGGSGLGLSICKSIIEMHEGTINFDSEVGKGTCFYFDLAR